MPQSVGRWKVGAGGVRAWFTDELFDDGELRISSSGIDAHGREVVASGTFCANAKYNAIQCMPWADNAKDVTSR
jgi:hypothetical protein